MGFRKCATHILLDQLHLLISPLTCSDPVLPSVSVQIQRQEVFRVRVVGQCSCFPFPVGRKSGTRTSRL